MRYVSFRRSIEKIARQTKKPTPLLSPSWPLIVPARSHCLFMKAVRHLNESYDNYNFVPLLVVLNERLTLFNTWVSIDVGKD